MPRKERTEMPSTLKRSPEKAKRTWKKAHDSAVGTYGEGSRAHRTAFAALKHSFEKVGDHWQPKGRKGPSDARAASGGPRPRGESFSGIDVRGSTKEELMRRAKRLGAKVGGGMKKEEVARSLERKQKQAGRKRRKG